MFSGGSDGKETACDAGDWVRSLGQEDSPGEGNGNPLQYPCPENSMDRGALTFYSPRRHKESDMTEWLTLSLFTFMYLLAIFLSSMEKCIFKSSIHFLFGLLFFSSQLYEFLIYFVYQILIIQMICKYFPSFHRLLFHYIDCYFSCAEAFSLMQSYLLFLFLLLTLWCHIQKNHCQDQCQCQRAFAMYFLGVYDLGSLIHVGL